MSSVIEKVKNYGKGVLKAIVKPLLVQQHNRVTWEAYGKWRTFTHNNGRVILRRYRQQPKGAEVVGNAREATEYATEAWGVELDSRGRLPAAPPQPTPLPVATPIFNRALYLNSRGFYPISRRPPRITPLRPRLRR